MTDWPYALEMFDQRLGDPRRRAVNPVGHEIKRHELRGNDDPVGILDCERTLVGNGGMTDDIEVEAVVGGEHLHRVGQLTPAHNDEAGFFVNLAGQRFEGGLTRIDHAAGAQKVGKQLRPTQLLIFGNPKVGTELMSSQQSAGIDLPIRVAAWEDASGQVWIGYTAPAALASRHAIGDRDPVVAKMTGALGKLTDAASK